MSLPNPLLPGNLSLLANNSKLAEPATMITSRLNIPLSIRDFKALNQSSRTKISGYSHSLKKSMKVLWAYSYTFRCDFHTSHTLIAKIKDNSKALISYSYRELWSWF